MVDLYQDINFDFSTKDPKISEKELKRALKEVCASHQRLKNEEIRAFKKPLLNVNYDSYIVVMGTPIVDENKKSKLELLIKAKILKKFNLDEALRSIDFEMGDNGLSTGNIIMGFSDAEKAIEAAIALDRFILDKNHTFSALTFGDYLGIVDNTVEDETTNFMSRKMLANWQDQSFLRLQALTSTENKFGLVDFHTLKETITIKRSTEFDTFIKKLEFSASGNYLIVYYNNCFELYGGKDLKKITRIHHSKVKKVVFSPHEDHVMSFNGTVSDNKSAENIIVWNLFTGVKLRIFKLVNKALENTYAFDSTNSFVSGIQEVDNKRHTFVYDLKTMVVVADPVTQKRSQLDTPNPINCAWSKSDSLLAVASGVLDESTEPQNARNGIFIFKIPERTKISWVNFTFKILEANLIWATFDKLLNAEMIIKVKKKNEKLVQAGYVDFPKRRVLVSTVENIGKTEMPELIYSPNGKYLVTLTEDPKSRKYRIDFISIEKIDNSNYKPKVLDTIDKQRYKTVYFCPFSRFVLLVEGKNILFAEFKEIKNKTEFKLIKEIETKGFNKIEWSPCGRFIALTRKVGQNCELSIYDIYGKVIKDQLVSNSDKIFWRSFALIPDYMPSKPEIENFKTEIKDNFDQLKKEDDKVIDLFKVLESEQREENLKTFYDYFEQKMVWWKDSVKYRKQKIGYDEDIITDYEVRFRIDKEEVLDEIKVYNE